MRGYTSAECRVVYLVKLPDGQRPVLKLFTIKDKNNMVIETCENVVEAFQRSRYHAAKHEKETFIVCKNDIVLGSSTCRP